MGIEIIQKFIPPKHCKSCMASHQKFKTFQSSILKIAEFLERLHVDIEGLLLVIFLGFWDFFSIKDNV